MGASNTCRGPLDGIIVGSRTAPNTPKEAILQYASSIKVHDPGHSGVLVELHGEFDVACLWAFRRALRRATELREPTFVDVSGVTFMDTLCLRELAARDPAARVCRPSWQFELSVTACGLNETILILPDDDPGYEAVIAEACGCGRVRSGGGPTTALLLNEVRTGLPAGSSVDGEGSENVRKGAVFP